MKSGLLSLVVLSALAISLPLAQAEGHKVPIQNLKVVQETGAVGTVTAYNHHHHHHFHGGHHHFHGGHHHRSRQSDLKASQQALPTPQMLQVKDQATVLIKDAG